MKKTKIIVKKKKQPTRQRQKQKQKQSVNVNVNIDQSKRTTQRKPKSDAASTTTMPHGENYIKPSALSNLQPVVYQQPKNQVYGQLQPVGNISDSMNRMIENGQIYNSVLPHQKQEPNNGLFSTGPTYNVLNVALQARKIQDEINSNLETFERLNSSSGNVEFLDDDENNNEENNDEPVPALEPNEPEVMPEVIPEEPKNEPSQSQSQSQSQVIEEPKNVTRKYLNALKPAQVRQYAEQLGIETTVKNKTNDYYKDVSKNKLISAILMKLKNANENI